ncbi:hypothetical protein [Saccharicrinis fermentans]|uniref:Uncharacterized protein n=1 Tax=Saccharicrinis fermentans DSM 9555 = JCM 21142 TaxID=869213 RepID=W7Y9N2_9BACT|nr:hypothetical protein [Saccharicrinis fermentans]GAF05047.1 hypothetical protein JCM21142_93770 [Saccharicrinis fermentans DSM 9555 = JCM 21142]
MKNKLIYGLFSLVFLLAACDDDDSNEFFESATVSIDVSEVTIFDSPFDIELTVSNPGVDMLTLTGGELVSEELSVEDMSASKSLSALDFGGYWKADSSLVLTTTIDFDSYMSTSQHSIDVVDAIAATGGDMIYEYDSVYSRVSFDVETMFNDIESIVVEKKVITSVDADPAFVEMESKSAMMTYMFKDSVYGVDFNLEDTIVYKITAMSGAYMETKMIEIPVGAQSLVVEDPGVLSDSKDSFELVKDAGEITFTSTDISRGFTSSDVAFVKVEIGDEFETEEDVYNLSKVVDVVEAASLVSSVDNVVIGEMYAYKFDYMGNVMYGVLTVSEVTSTVIGDDENSITFSYSQAVKYEKDK